MKKWLWIIMLFVLVVCSCNANSLSNAEQTKVEWDKTEQDNAEYNNIDQNETKQGNTSEYDTEEIRQMSSELVTSLHRNINSTYRMVGPEGNMALTNLGMYYAVGIYSGSSFKMMFFDSVTGESVVVCSNASCEHRNRSCEAIYAPGTAKETEEGVIDSNIKVTPLGVYEDRLYVMVSEKIDSKISLYASELSGHNRELIWSASYPGANVEHRMLIADSVIWNGSKAYVNYYSEAHIAKNLKVLDEETQAYVDVYANYVANLGNGILCIDVSDTRGPIRICEEDTEFFFEETETGSMDMYALDRGYVVMMAAKDGAVYYRYMHTDEVLDQEAYMADPSSYKTYWYNTVNASIMCADVQQGQVLSQKVFALDEGYGARSEYCDGNIYYNSQGKIWKYDLVTNQQEEVTALQEEEALETVTEDYLILRNYTDQQMYFIDLDTKEVVVKDAEVGNNFYGQVAFLGNEYWFFRSSKRDTDGVRRTQWFLVNPEEYLTQEDFHPTLVYQRSPLD